MKLQVSYSNLGDYPLYPRNLKHDICLFSSSADDIFFLITLSPTTTFPMKLKLLPVILLVTSAYQVVTGRAPLISLRWPSRTTVVRLVSYPDRLVATSFSSEYEPLKDSKNGTHERVEEPPSEYANYTVHAETLYDTFVDKLKSFIFTTHFDTCRFSDRALELSYELQSIASRCHEIIRENESVSRQHQFAQFMLEILVICMHELAGIRSVASEGSYLAYDVTELNACILSLYDSHGQLDRTISGYKTVLRRFRRKLTSYGRVFNELTDMSEWLEQIFVYQQKHAWKMLDALSGQLS